MALTPKQLRFVSEYLIDLNAVQAAIRAGYSKNTARQQGSVLLTHVDVRAEISRKQAEHLQAADLTAQRVLEEYRRIAFMDIRTFFDDAGNLRPIPQLTAEQGCSLASLEVIVKNAEAGDGHTDRVHKFKLWDKLKALESLAKHFGLLTEKIEHSGVLVIHHMMLGDEA